MSVSPEFADHLADLFGPLGAVEIKRMFGAAGVFHQGVMIALLADEVLYLKTDDRNRADFEAAQCAPFAFERRGRTMRTSYYECPPELLEDADAFAPWVRKAFDAALAADAKK